MQSIRRSGKHRPRQSESLQPSVEALEPRQLLASTWVTFSINPYYGVAESHVENGVTLGSDCSLVVNYFWDGPNAPGGSVNVTIGGTATSGVDYAPCSTTVSIPGNNLPYPGGGTQVIPMTTVPDNLVEGPEIIELRFSTSDTLKLRPFGLPDWIPYTPMVSVAIVDSPPIVNIYPVHDGYEDGEPMRFLLTRGGGVITTPVSVSLGQGTGGTASGSDYQLPSVSILTEAYIDVPVTDDSEAEWSETAVIEITGAGTTYVVGGSPQAQAEIVDNDWAITGLPENLVVSSEDLYPISIVSPSSGPPDAVISVYCPPSVILWEDSDRSSSPLTNGNGSYYWFATAPATLWLEAIAPSTVIGDIVLQVSGTNPATSQQSPANPATSQPGSAWKLNGITVISGATRTGVRSDGEYADDWIAVKNATEKAVIEADISGPGGVTDLPEGWLTWEGAEAVADPKNRANASRVAPAKTAVTAKLDGKEEKKLDLWVIWAVVQAIQVDGPRPTSLRPFFRDPGGFYGDPPVPETLGWHVLPASQGPVLTGRMALAAKLEPAGVGDALALTPEIPEDPNGRQEVTALAFRRARETRFFVDGQLQAVPGNPQTIGTTDHEVDDTTIRSLRLQDLDPSGDDIIYDRDAPTLHNNEGPALSAFEIHHKFRQHLEFNGQKCSDDYFWRWSAVWIAGAEPFPVADRTLSACASNWSLPSEPIHPLLQ